MIEQVFSYILSVPPLYVYLIVFFFSFIENIFPPSPSDVIVILGATTIAVHNTNFLFFLLASTLGSSVGFMTMFYIGKWFGEHIIRNRKLKFISPAAIEKTDLWFKKYGYKLIVANRFMPGTRAVVSFFAGFSEIDPLKSFITASLSAMLWNAFIIYLGFQIGANLNKINYYMNIYSHAAITVTISAVIVYFVVRLIKNRKTPNNIN